MSVGYVAVQWNRPKKIYDLVVAGSVLLYLIGFVLVGKLLWRGDHAISTPILLMRALGTCAFGLLHAILCIGPLARLRPRFLPLLYNRRHLGVLTFLIALLHGVIVLGFYHGFGVINPLLSLLTINTDVTHLRSFPFQWLGLAGLVIMFLMAATSHDFWLRNLTARTWKSLHMLVYVAYALLVLHVVLGALQAERSGVYVGVVLAGAGMVIALHLITGSREARRDTAAVQHAQTEGARWIDAGEVSGLIEGRGRVVTTAGGERIAVFRHGDKVCAMTNVCAHQGGPLGEGRVLDGCVTCPWHGWQYRVETAEAPPPFVERVSAHRVQLLDGRVLIDPTACPPGAAPPPATIEEPRHA